MDEVELSEAEFLAGYDPGAYPGVGLTADIVALTLIDAELCVLLIKRGGHPFKGCWALPGGFVNVDESSVQAATRELAEETGVELFHLEQLGTYDTPGRDPRMRVASVAYLAVLPEAVGATGDDDAVAAEWWPVGELDELELAFDHARIIADGVERISAKLEYTALATSFLRAPFTMGELRRVYEAIWVRTLHAANFRRKVLSAAGFVVPAGQTRSVGRGARVETFCAGAAVVLYPPIVREVHQS